MSIPDLYGTFYPGFSRLYQVEQLETNSFPLYQGETFNGDLYILNSGTEKAEAFDVDLYVSTDGMIDTNDYYIGTYNFAGGIEGESSYLVRDDDFPKNSVSATLPNSDSDFWEDLETYYVGAIIDPDNAIAESDESNNNSDFPSPYFEYFATSASPITVKLADLPVVSFIQEDHTLQINLSEPASEEGFTIDYRNTTREDYFNGVIAPSDDFYQYYYRPYLGNRFYDPEFNRLYIAEETYYDLADYKYYDADGGHYDPTEDKYFNADGSYYDLGEKLFYDAEENATELTDNSAEYTDSAFSPRHYLATGGYISLVSGIYYNPYGGYIDEATEEYFFREGENGLGGYSANIDDLITEVGALEFGFGRLPAIATPDLDYEMILGENIAEITDSTITIAPGETTATIDFNFLTDSVFDPLKTIEFELLANEQEYLVGRSYLYKDFAPVPNLKDLKNPASGNHNFSLASNAQPETTIGHVNLSHPQGDELIYTLVSGSSGVDLGGEIYLYNYRDIALNPELIETSNQDLDGDGIHPFSINFTTGTITLSDPDDLDPALQLYNDGYYQLFVRATDETVTQEDNIFNDTADLYETSLVNIKVLDIEITPGDDNLKGFAGKDNINGLAGNDTINGLAGNDTLMGDQGNDRLIGAIGNDLLYGGAGNDFFAGMDGLDTLQEEMGNDTLNGGAGIDSLEGNAGADLFVLKPYFGQDLIVDFEDGTDLLALSGGLSFEQLNVVELSIYDSIGIYDDSSNQIIAVLNGVEANLITEADFIAV